MGILRFVLWTAACIGLGIFVSTAEFSGKTPLQHLTRVWKHERPRLERVKDSAEEAVDDVKRRVSTKEVAKGPTEQHSSADREAIDQIIAKRK
jgi:hypothetical protein